MVDNTQLVLLDDEVELQKAPEAYASEDVHAG